MLLLGIFSHLTNVTFAIPYIPTAIAIEGANDLRLGNAAQLSHAARTFELLYTLCVVFFSSGCLSRKAKICGLLIVWCADVAGYIPR